MRLHPTRSRALADAWIAALAEPPLWLIHLSLARPEHQWSCLETAAVEPSGELMLHALTIALSRDRIGVDDFARSCLNIGWDHSLPDPVHAAIHQLDEDALCAHEFDGVPQPERVAACVRRLSAAIGAASPFHATIAAALRSATGGDSR